MLEFQAGPASSFGERVAAIAERAAVEGLGFGLIALVLGAVALLLAALRSDRSEVSLGRRTAATGLLVAVAFEAWVLVGAWVMDQAVPFLPPFELLKLNLAGVALAVVGLAIYDAIVRRLPWTPRGAPIAAAVGSALAFGFAFWVGLKIVRGVSGGWRLAGAPGRLRRVFPRRAAAGIAPRPHARARAAPAGRAPRGAAR